MRMPYLVITYFKDLSLVCGINLLLLRVMLTYVTIDDNNNSTPLTIDCMNMCFQEENLGFVLIFLFHHFGKEIHHISPLTLQETCESLLIIIFISRSLSLSLSLSLYHSYILQTPVILALLNV